MWRARLTNATVKITWVCFHYLRESDMCGFVKFTIKKCIIKYKIRLKCRLILYIIRSSSLQPPFQTNKAFPMNDLIWCTPILILEYITLRNSWMADTLKSMSARLYFIYLFDQQYTRNCVLAIICPRFLLSTLAFKTS